MGILTIARITLKEASRRKLLLAVGIITILVIPLVAWGFSRIPTFPCRADCGPGTLRGVEAGLLILVAYMFSFVIAVATPFLAAPTISGDVESHVILAILPRPIRRSEVVLGKWLGLAILVAVYTSLTCGLEFLGVRIAVGYVAPHPMLTILFIVGEAITLLTLALLGSTRLSPITCGIVSVILFGIAWIVGVAGQIGAAFGNTVIANVGTIASLVLPTDGMWRGAIFNLEPISFITTTNTARLASANPFTVGSAPTTGYVIWAILWIFGVLGLSVWSFSKREV